MNSPRDARAAYQVPVVLRVIATCQVSEGGRHVGAGSCSDAQILARQLIENLRRVRLMETIAVLQMIAIEIDYARIQPTLALV